MSTEPQETNVVGNVKVEPHKGPRANAKRYFALLRPECPVDAVSFGRVTFHKQTYTRSPEGDPIFRQGQVIDLTDAELENTKKDLQTRVCRLVFGKSDDGSLFHMGQQDVAFARWARPGDRDITTNELIKGDDGQPLKSEKLVPMPGYEHDVNDVPWTKYVALKEINAEQERFVLEMLDPVSANVLTPKAASELNASSADAEESIATGAAGQALKAQQGVRKALRGAGVMGRE